MGSVNTLGEAMDRVEALGGHLRLEGKKIKIRLPEDCPDALKLVQTIRSNREAVIAMLEDIVSKPPSLEEVTAMLTGGVRLVSYRPKQAPFAVAPISIVTDAGKFFRAYLKDLAWRLEHPDGYAAPPLADILAKLAEAGLELNSQSSP
jgi:hypothetical protein